MHFYVVVFGYWPEESIRAAASGSTLKAAFATAFVLGLIGVAAAVVSSLRGKSGPPSRAQLLRTTAETTEMQLDKELAVILRFMRSYVDANEKYSDSLAQAHRNLLSLTKPEQVRTIVKFLIAENQKMQAEADNLRCNLDQSRTQIEKLRWNLAEAQELGLRDPLTSLSNRRCFDLNLAKEIEEAHTNQTALCLVMGDIDRFKAINDAFGHQIGDEILRMFAKLLSSNVKGRDTVARFGGEEFAIILPETRLADAEHLTENIRRQLESKQLAVNNSGEPIGQVTASFGVAELYRGEDADTLVNRADARLYEAKCAGRNRVVADTPAAA